MGIFGWDYPPGCNSVPGDEPDPPCEVCGGDIDGGKDECICPECPVCEEIGTLACYLDHGMHRTEEQKFDMECHKRQWEDEARSWDDYATEWNE